jgi:hypothetical protein
VTKCKLSRNHKDCNQRGTESERESARAREREREREREIEKEKQELIILGENLTGRKVKRDGKG